MTDLRALNRDDTEHGKTYYLASDVVALLDERDALKKQNRILEVKNASSLANNLCPDHRDKQAFKSCLACEIERLKDELQLLRHAAEELLSNEEHAVSGGRRSYQKGSPTWILWEGLRFAAALKGGTP